MTVSTNPSTNISLPAGAALVDDWTDTRTPTPFRYFEGSRRTVERPHHDTDIDIYVSGTQHHDGSISRDIVVHELHHDHPITLMQARQLAAALTAAADEAEQMAGYDQTTFPIT
jgi:hypothetical protein